MKKLALTTLAAVALTALASPAAFAHTGVGATSGFAHGFLHPITGLDHVLAMVLVGVFAFQLGGRALWLVPSTFVLVMAIGGALGVAGIGVPFVETGIALYQKGLQLLRMASRAPTARSGQTPARTSPITRSRAPAPDASSARTAKPSIAARSKGGWSRSAMMMAC